jgi:Family of unknown function (DUF6544)
MRIFLGLACLVIAAAMVAVMTLDARFGREIADAVRLLRASPPSAVVDPGKLPPQVRAFAERAVADSPEIPVTIDLDQRAEMRLEPDGQWLPVAARHVAAIRTPGFVWRATAPMMPMVRVKAYDALVGGKGRLVVRLLGAISVADASGPQVSRGEAMRYLAELPWTPHAILANSALRWRVIDARTIEVSTDSAGGPATVRLTFDDAGDIVVAESEDRPRDVDGRFVPTRWRGIFSDYGIVDGVRLPRRAEVSWILEDGADAYFRAEIVGVELHGKSP